MAKRSRLEGQSSHFEDGFPSQIDFTLGNSSKKLKAKEVMTKLNIVPKPSKLDASDDFRPTYGTQLASGVKVPIGHCFVNEKWRGSPIANNINKMMTVKFMDGLGSADFQPGNNTIVMVLAEADIVREENFLIEKIKKLYKQKEEQNKKHNFAAVIIFSKTAMTEQYLGRIEQLSVLEFSIPVIPLADINQEIGQVLQQLGNVSRQTKNPFRVDPEKKKMENSDKNILLALLEIPNLGEKNARALLNKFGSIRGVARARAGEMEHLVGAGLAKGIEDYFRRKNTV